MFPSRITCVLYVRYGKSNTQVQYGKNAITFSKIRDISCA